MTDEQLAEQVRALCALDPEAWFMNHALIKDKSGKLVAAPKPNVLQRRMFAYYRECMALGKPCLMIILKPRQCGASTGSQAITYHHGRRLGSLNGALMGDIAATSDKVFEIYKRYAENDTLAWPDELGRLRKGDLENNKTDDITLPGGSEYHKETAGSANAGRSGTVQIANMTEVAFFRSTGASDATAGFLGSFNDASVNSLAIADSTPNGATGWFYKTCMNKNSEWKFIFAAWFEFEEHSRPFASDQERAEFMANLTDDERDELARFNKDRVITPEKLHWRRKTLHNKCEGSLDRLRQEYPSDPVECFLMSARQRFDQAAVARMATAAESATSTAGCVNVDRDAGKAVFVPDQAGLTRIFEEPRFGCSYLVSVDSMTGEDQVASGGTADPDYHSIQVWRHGYVDDRGRHVLPRLVAKHDSRVEIDLCALEAYGLSLMYGNCLIVPEVNNCGLALIVKLKELGANIYRRSTVNATTGVVDKQLGWKTDAITRKTIIDTLATKIRDGEIDIPCLATCEQLKAFIIKKSGRTEAMPGKHDDMVLSAAIGVYNLPMATEYTRPTRSAPEPGFCGMSADGFMDAEQFQDWLASRE